METLGINLHTILVQLAGFVVVYLFLKKFLFVPLQRVMEQRRRETLARVTSLEEERKRIQVMKEDLERRLQSIYEEKQELLQKELQKAQEMSQEILNEAREEAERIRQKVQRDMELEREKMLVSLRQDVVKLAISIAERALRASLDEKKQRELINRLLEDLEHGDSNQIRHRFS